MASVNENAQWIVMLGFIISIILIFLALIVNQSALVGKTTSESVLEFPKSSIQDLRAEVRTYNEKNQIGNPNRSNLSKDVLIISMHQKGALVHVQNTDEGIIIRYNDGSTNYHENAWNL